jgi:hypothetical protein
MNRELGSKIIKHEKETDNLRAEKCVGKLEISNEMDQKQVQLILRHPQLHFEEKIYLVETDRQVIDINNHTMSLF